MRKSILILAGGGPAPGINAVVASIAKTFMAKGFRVLGLHGGYKGLFSMDPDYMQFDFRLADSIFDRGGSFLRMSRYKPTETDYRENFNLRFFKDHDIKLLVTIGGDDTASTANAIEKFLEANKYRISSIHVPKTIDNDLPLPENAPTFGFYSAAASGTTIASTIYEDAKSSGSWFIVSAMGRSAGYLALEIGGACHYPMIIIPEMFNRTEITLDKILNLGISSILKRKAMGIDYGAIMVSEGVFHKLGDKELIDTGITFTYDDHGHPELGKISKAQMFNDLLDAKLEKLGLKVKSRPVEIGYEVRCSDPIAFDLMYCSQLGMGVYQLYTEGHTGCMVFVDERGYVTPLFLKGIQDPATGKILPRAVDITTDRSRAIFDHLMNYVTEDDYDSVRAWVENPAEYDFRKILNW